MNVTGVGNIEKKTMIWVIVFLAVSWLGFGLFNRLNAVVQQDRRAKTTETLRMIGKAIEAFAASNGFYPHVTKMNDLAALLEPKYVQSFPRKDSWGNEFRYQSFTPNPQYSKSVIYVIASSGKDGIWEQENLRDYKSDPGMNGDYNDDLVFSNGEFIQLRKTRQK